MKLFQISMVVMMSIGASVAVCAELRGLSAQTASPATAKPSPAYTSALPRDVFPETGNRFPPVSRDALDESGKTIYDERGVFGPGVKLHSQTVADYMGRVNDYLRRDSGLDARLVQMTILVAAREMDSEYVWTSHVPQARKAGLETEIIDIIKYRKPVNTLGEKEAVIIELGRQSMGKHKVNSDTFAHAVKLFGNKGLVNVLALMGDYAATAILLNAADQQLRPGDVPLLARP